MNKRVAILPFPEIENAYVAISGKTAETSNGVSSTISFLYATEEIAVEWEPNYGPITVLYKCDKTHPKAKEHWFFDYTTGYRNWSQLAVNRTGLGEKFSSGNYKALFQVLKSWHDNAD